MLEGIEQNIFKISDQHMLYKLDVADGLFWLFDVLEGTCFNLNEISYFILSSLDGRTPLSEVLQSLCSRHPDQDSDIVTNDLNDLIVTLSDRGIIVGVENNTKKEVAQHGE